MSDCKECFLNCSTCENFEDIISQEYDVTKLKNIRLAIVSKKLKADLKLSDKIATAIVSRLGTMTFFWCCVALATIPLIFPKTMSTVAYISSGYIQLIFLPLIMIAGNIADKARETKNDREFRILTINDRIDELQDDSACGRDYDRKVQEEYESSLKVY